MQRAVLAWICGIFLASGVAGGKTYYVSPKGDDTADGLSADHPWKSCQKVNGAALVGGDSVLFMRGGEWRESLVPGSDGKAGAPIVFDAYGDGAKPKFWGSDLLANADFASAGDGKYSIKIAADADTALVDHVFIPADWNAGTLTITSTSDPRTDGKVYTAGVRGNVIFSNRKNHLVFRNLIVDETAGQLKDGGNQGYGVRIEGSTDVLVEYCEAYRCARHHFAAINTTGFVGRHLVAGYVQPKTPGDNTAYVSYADTGAPVAHCTSEWDDISAVHMENGTGGQYIMFVSHGDQQGQILMKNSTSTTKISFMSAPVIVKGMTLKETASIENFGKGILIEDITLLDSSAIDQWATDGTIQNCVANLTPTGGGPTGYGATIVCRDKANNNVIRFNSLTSGRFTCLTLAGNGSNTKVYGNIMMADGSTLFKASGDIGTGDIAMADYNFYSPSANFGGKDFTAWQGLGFDAHSLTGDPAFTDVGKGDFTLGAGSKCIGTAKVAAADVPADDFAGKKRDTSSPSMGAFEAQK